MNPAGKSAAAAPLLSVLMLLLAFGTPLPLRGEDARQRFDRIETSDGRVYTDVVVQRILPDRIIFMHADGAATVTSDHLSPQVVQRLWPEKKAVDGGVTPAPTPVEGGRGGGSGPSPLADAFVPPYPLKLDSLVTLDGQEYTDLVITNVGVLELSFRHARGSASVPFARLPEGVRHEYLYDPDKAEAYLQEVKALLGKQHDAEIARLRQEAAAARAAAEAARKAPDPAEPPASAPAKGSIAGAWQRRLGKNQIGVKIYAAGRISTTVYDSKGRVQNQNGGTWSEGGGYSIEKLQYATDNWSFLIGKTIRHEVRFQGADTIRLTNEQGGVEEWTRLPAGGK